MIALRLFVSSAAFTAVLAVSYWLIAHDPAGTVLLSFMTAALLVIAIYTIAAAGTAIQATTATGITNAVGDRG